MSSKYRGRIAPTPTGYLHLGHARTFWIAMQRAQKFGGHLIYREENIDSQRCKSEFAQGAVEDLRWFGCNWHEGPDVGGPYGPYRQSERRGRFIGAWEKLKNGGFIYPCNKSRKDVERAAQAPHLEEEVAEPIYPINWRPSLNDYREVKSPAANNWRFRLPEKRIVEFNDQRLGHCAFECLSDFGDFLVWRKDDVPSYELAVVVDDAAMQISEVVRGEDLLLSTARQLLLYEALEIKAPNFYHAPLLCDTTGRRLAKRNQSLTLRELRHAGHSPNSLRLSGDWHLSL